MPDMSNAPDDAAFEDFLRRFQPPAPAPLPRAPGRGPWRVRWLAAALVLLAAGTWLQRRVERDGPARAVPPRAGLPNWGVLAGAATGDAAALDAELERQVPRAMQDVSRKDGALRVLAEFRKDL